MTTKLFKIEFKDKADFGCLNARNYGYLLTKKELHQDTPQNHLILKIKSIPL